MSDKKLTKEVTDLAYDELCKNPYFPAVFFASITGNNPRYMSNFLNDLVEQGKYESKMVSNTWYFRPK